MVSTKKNKSFLLKSKFSPKVIFRPIFEFECIFGVTSHFEARESVENDFSSQKSNLKKEIFEVLY